MKSDLCSLCLFASLRQSRVSLQLSDAMAATLSGTPRFRSLTPFGLSDFATQECSLKRISEKSVSGSGPKHAATTTHFPPTSTETYLPRNRFQWTPLPSPFASSSASLLPPSPHLIVSLSLHLHPLPSPFASTSASSLARSPHLIVSLSPHLHPLPLPFRSQKHESPPSHPPV